MVDNSPVVNADARVNAVDKKFMSRTMASEKAMKKMKATEGKMQEKGEKDGNTYRK
jgi:hypothetical protein